jgi:hypothetical protein
MGGHAIQVLSDWFLTLVIRVIVDVFGHDGPKDSSVFISQCDGCFLPAYAYLELQLRISAHRRRHFSVIADGHFR